MHKLRIILVLLLLVIVGGEGILLVTDFLAQRLPNPPKHCFGEPNEYKKWICFLPYFTDLVNKTSAGYAMRQAKSFKTNGVVDACHLIAHHIGETALEKYDFDAGQAFASCEFGCIEGCFHGVMERLVRSTADPSAVASAVKNMCDMVRTPNLQKEALLKSQCAHGIGHGLVAHGFLPVAQAVSACQGLEGGLFQARCRGGVAMEHVEQYLSLEENKLKETLPAICAPFKAVKDANALYDCHINIGIVLMWYTKHDLSLSQKLCEELQKPEYIYVCKEGTEEEDVINVTN